MKTLKARHTVTMTIKPGVKANPATGAKAVPPEIKQIKAGGLFKAQNEAQEKHLLDAGAATVFAEDAPVAAPAKAAAPAGKPAAAPVKPKAPTKAEKAAAAAAEAAAKEAEADEEGSGDGEGDEDEGEGEGEGEAQGEGEGLI